MRKSLVLALAAVLALPACAHHPHQPYRDHRGEWVVPALVIGGIAATIAAQPRVVQPEPPQLICGFNIDCTPVQPIRPYCRAVPTYDAYGRYVNTQMICQ